MKIEAVTSSYARWAPIYDRTFGSITKTGRSCAVDYINETNGSVLEVGVGTGLSLSEYKKSLSVTGIDFSHEMLAKAREKVQQMNLSQVAELRQMDARQLDFPDSSFDTVVAMHVMSVVPEPEIVMAEIERVLKPGGRVVITNHFKQTKGLLAVLERAFSPFANLLGWHSDFELETVLQQPSLSVEQQKKLPPMGMMTFLVLRKTH